MLNETAPNLIGAQLLMRNHLLSIGGFTALLDLLLTLKVNLFITDVFDKPNRTLYPLSKKGEAYAMRACAH